MSETRAAATTTKAGAEKKYRTNRGAVIISSDSLTHSFTT
jgi:hypothetical protein